MVFKDRHNEEKDEELWEIGDDSEEDCDSDDSMKDPSFSILEDTDSKFSMLLIESKPKARVVKDSEADFDGQEVVLPELDEKAAKSFEMVQKIIEAGQIEKLKVEQCKLYLRKNGLRLTGNKDTLIRRIKEHLEILNGGGEKKNPVSSFVLNCKGDACTGDVVMFEQNVYEMFDIASRSGKGPPCGTRIVAGRIVKESYGAAKQQHTFTIEVLWSKGEKPLPSLHPLLIKGRNLYRLKTLRQRWEDEGDRQKVLMEKHSRGSLARSDREARVQVKEMRKMLKTNRISRKEEPKKNQSQFKSSLVLKSSAQPQQSGSLVNPQNLHQPLGMAITSGSLVLKSSAQPQQSGSLVNPQNLHQPLGIAVTSGNMKMGSQQLGLLTDSAPQPPAPNPSFLVDFGNTTTQPQPRTHTTMTGKYFNQASQHWDESRIPENTKRVYHQIGGARNLKVNMYHSISNVPIMKGIPLNSQRQPLTSVNMSPRGPKQMCRYYAQGRCYYGENCKFSHDTKGNYNERRVERLPQSHQQMELGHYGNSSKVCHEMREKYGERMEVSWPHHVQRRF